MTTDRGTVRIIAAGLMLLALAVVVGIFFVVASGDVDAGVKTAAMTTAGAIGTTAVGAGAALLASTRNAPQVEELADAAATLGGPGTPAQRLNDLLPDPEGPPVGGAPGA